MAKESSQLGQEETPCPPPEAPSLCSNNCGFFGSSATMNLCSSCYRKLVLLKAKPASSSPSTISPNKAQVQEEDKEEVKTAELSSSFSGGDVSPLALASPPSSDGSPEARRCFSCRKRIGLTGFKCRCGDVFCALHRYSDKHNCSFDYKAAARAAIAKANPVVKAEKLARI